MSDSQNHAKGNSAGETSAPPAGAMDSAILELGRRMYMDSVVVGRDTCRSLASLATAGIPVAAAMGLFVPKAHLSQCSTYSLSVAVVLFLSALLVFVLGSWPRPYRIDLDDLTSIRDYRTSAIEHCVRSLKWGLVLFALGTVALCIAVVMRA